jgi:hypothetical protein
LAWARLASIASSATRSLSASTGMH